jgi:hypothetical protein
MAMTRRNRWEHREILKADANQRGNLDAHHPQARRGIDEAKNQVDESEKSERMEQWDDEAIAASEYDGWISYAYDGYESAPNASPPSSGSRGRASRSPSSS